MSVARLCTTGLATGSWIPRGTEFDLRRRRERRHPCRSEEDKGPFGSAARPPDSVWRSAMRAHRPRLMTSSVPSQPVPFKVNPGIIFVARGASHVVQLRTSKGAIRRRSTTPGACRLRGPAEPTGPQLTIPSRHSHLVIVSRIIWPSRAAIAHPSTSQLSGTRGCRTSAAPAMHIATIGASSATASAISMTGPIPGMIRISRDERRINRNESHIAAQIARQ